MDEYIKRESAVKAANEWVSEACKEPVMRASRLFDKLQKVPVADVAPVVRCRECKNWRPEGYISVADPQNPQCGGRCWYSNVARFENDFCSYGVRKDGVDNG